MFGRTFSEKNDSAVVYSRKSKAGGSGIFIINPLEVKNVISNLIRPDFKVLSGNTASHILHRKVGERDLYFVYGVPKGTKCFFRCSGKVELWNPWEGKVLPLKVSAVSETGTTIQLPLEKSEPQLIVFSPGKPEIENAIAESINKTDTLVIDNNWEFELKPTLDNKYGDYRLPAFDGKLGVEVWKMKYSDETTPNADWQNPDFDDSNWTTASVSFGPQFWKLGPIPANVDSKSIEAKLASLAQVNPSEPVEINGMKYFWNPYEFSWRWGLKDDAGHQGYHGMKGHVNSELISLGKINKSNILSPIYPLEAEEGGSVYYLWSTVSSPRQMQAKISKTGLLPEKFYLNHILVRNDQEVAELESGNNPVLLKYNKVGRGYFLFEANQANTAWKQSVPLASKWYLKPSVLPFNCLPQSKDRFGLYRFMAPPGARTMFIQSISKPGVWISGTEISCHQARSKQDKMVDKNVPVWEIILPATLLNSSSVALRVEQTPGFYGGAAIPEPVLFECANGKIQLGDLGENGSLRTYSGGMWYRKTLNLTAEQTNSSNIILDLGKVVASAEVFVNRESSGSKVSSPWKFDLTGRLHAGENRIEILVYNTLGNHFLTTPSMYVGRTNSGLIGPVRLEFSSVIGKK